METIWTHQRGKDTENWKAVPRWFLKEWIWLNLIHFLHMWNGIDWGGRSETKLLCCWMWKLIFFNLLLAFCASSFPFHKYQQAKVPGARLQGEDYGTVQLKHQLGWTLFRGTLLAGVHGQGEWVLNADVYGPISSKESTRCELIHKM